MLLDFLALVTDFLSPLNIMKTIVSLAFFRYDEYWFVAAQYLVLLLTADLPLKN